MTDGLYLTADGGGNVVAHLNVTTAESVAHIEDAGPGLVVLELGADEPVQVRFTMPPHVLTGVLWDALGQLERLGVSDGR